MIHENNAVTSEDQLAPAGIPAETAEAPADNAPVVDALDPEKGADIPREHQAEPDPVDEHDRARNIGDLGRCAFEHLQRRTSRLFKSSAGVALAASLAPLEYAGETPLVDHGFSAWAPQGPFSGPREAVVTLGLLGIVAGTNYVVARVSNTLPAIPSQTGEKQNLEAQAVDAAVAAPEQSRDTRHTAQRLGSTALHGLKTAGSKSWNAGWAVIGAPWKAIGKAGEKMEVSKHAFVRPIGRGAVDLCKAVTLGPAFTVMIEKAESAEKVTEPRIRRLSLLIAAGWFPAYYMVDGLIQGAYAGLRGLGGHAKDIAGAANHTVGNNVKLVTPGQVAEIANGANTGLHTTFDTIGALTNIATLEGQLAMSALTLGVAYSAIRNNRRSQRQIEVK